jgi:hypothetical protein
LPQADADVSGKACAFLEGAALAHILQRGTDDLGIVLVRGPAVDAETGGGKEDEEVLD